MIFLYSAKAIKANPTPPYSTLYPATNSDSPSTKSKGARFVSANRQIIQRIKISSETKLQAKFISRTSCKLKLPAKNKGKNKVVLKITSYETLCATARIAPKKE